MLYYVADTIGSNFTGIATDMAELSTAVEETLRLETRIAEVAKEVKNAKDIYILGRSIHLPICLEGALKIKELAYIHAEGMASRRDETRASRLNRQKQCCGGSES